MNGKVTEKKKAHKNTANNSLQFQTVQFESLEVSLPGDLSQIPHLFINVNVSTYEVQDPSQKKSGKKKQDTCTHNQRRGFIRVSPRDIVTQKDNKTPQWYVVQSIENRKKTIGRLLVNARLVR